MELDITTLDLLPAAQESRLYPCGCTCTLPSFITGVVAR
ncbi:ALQxL family class IV lanthipeptide [Streptosporangium sp. NPDC006013]